MYLAAFLLSWLGLRSRAKLPWSKVGPAHVDDVVFYGALGAIVGGRVGYMLVYGLSELVADPLSLFTVWKGGMSFHGGLSGVLIAMWIYARRTGLKFFDITDAIAPWASGGIFFGRMGNFINGELWGKPTSPDAPWAVIVDGEARHASQLYEAFLEGLRAVRRAVALHPQAAAHDGRVGVVPHSLWRRSGSSSSSFASPTSSSATSRSAG